jgi:riboflavin biosynthesis pyrimidine reductase
MKNRPYVICHMGSSVDGRIIAENWGDKKDRFGSLYEDCHKSFDSQAWMVGRITMEKNFTEGRQPKPVKAAKHIERKAFIGDKSAKSFAIAVDAKGKLGWEENEIAGDHIIEILSESVSDEYLQYLQDKSVSYLFAGKDSLDFNIVLSQLHDIFKIQTLMLEGGGHINGSLLNAGLIDELSLLILPVADGTINSPTTFEVGNFLPKKDAQQLKLIDVKRLEHDVLWLKYRLGDG